MTQAFTSPITSRLKGGLFNPLEFNPYLLFDAQTSMLGELEAPTLDLDASDESTLDVITATRAGVATYTDLHGTIKTASADTVRVDWSLGYPAMLIEPSATNLVTNSTSFNYNIVTPTSGIDAPDGTNTATRIEGLLGATGEVLYSQAYSVTPSSQITGSIYLRGTAGEVVTVYTKRYSGGTYVGSPVQNVLLTGEWQRVENMTVTLNADNTNAAVTITKSSQTTADSVDVWGGQIELGSVSTSVIPTSGSTVTRNADNLVIDGTAFSDFYNATEGTFYIEATERTQEVRAGFITGQGTSQFFLYHNGSADIYSYDGGAAINLINRPVNQLFRAAVTYTPTTKTISMNGAVSTVGVHNGNWAAANILNIGWANSQYIQFNGHLKRLIYWPTHSDSL